MQPLQSRFLLCGDKVAFDGGEFRYTYSDLYQLSLNLSSSVKENCLILFLIENDVRVLGLYAALLALKRPMILVSPSIDDEGLRHILKQYMPRYVVAKSNRYPRILGDDFQVTNVDNYIYDYKYKNYAVIDRNVSLLIGTSGGSGKSKYCILSHKNIIWSAIQVKKSLIIDSSHVVITTLPPSYVYGLSVINSHIFSGATIVVCAASILDKSFWGMVLKHNVTTLNFVPAQLDMLRRFVDKLSVCKAVKYVTQAGGPLTKDLATYWSHAFGANNINFFMMYGQTEASSRMSIARVKDPKLIGTVGKGIIGGKILVDSTSAINPSELVYIGRNIFCGYANGFSDLQNIKELTLLKTGDLGYADQDGNIYIVGRNSRNIKINSIRYSLDDIECYLNDSSYKVFCTELDNRLIVHHSSSVEGLVELVGQKFKIPKTAIVVNYIKNLPFNENGKPNYAELKS